VREAKMEKRLKKIKIPCILLSLLLMLSSLASTIQYTLAEPEDPEYIDIVYNGSIRGFIWTDGYDWKQPLADYIVYLYAADDLTNDVAVTQTDVNGVYIFEDIEPGYYILGLYADTINGTEYRLPDTITEYNKFKIDNNYSTAAYTDIIELAAGQAVQYIDAGLQPVVEEIEETTVPEEPTYPEEITVPEEPTYPEEPFYPEEPTYPEEPFYPEEPTYPEETIVPEEPTYPEEIFYPAPSSEPFTELGSISGFLWVDGNGTPPTGWNGIYDEGEYPLAGFTVYLYSANNIYTPLDITTTDWNGTYIFEGLEAGVYVLGVRSGFANGQQYLLPMNMTADNKFAMDMTTWTESYTAAVYLAEGQAVQEINAGMRLPMGIVPTAISPKYRELKYLGDAEKNDLVRIDDKYWIVVKTDTDTTPGEKYVYLLLAQGYSDDNWGFGSSTNYSSSLLRTRINKWMSDGYCPTIQAIAVVPNLKPNEWYSQTMRTDPTTEMAKNKTTDILFAPSYGDMREWVNGNTTSTNYSIPNTHPLHTDNQSPFNFAGRFYCRTAENSSSGNVAGVLRRHPTNGTSVNKLDLGIRATDLTPTYCSDVPAVWVKAGAVNRTIEVHYVDRQGNHIPIPTPNTPPNPATHNVTVGNAFTLPNVDLRDIQGYTYKEWKKGENGATNLTSITPNLTKGEVIDGIHLYLVYEKDQLPPVDVTVSKTVKGQFFDRSTYFDFTVYLQDANGPITGSINYNKGSVSGTLNLDHEGKDTFTLKHGESITLLDIPGDAKIRIVENEDTDYIQSFTDTSGAGGETDTGFRVVMVNGATTRTFAFLNEQKAPIVPTGIADDLWGAAALPLTAGIFLLSFWIIRKFIMRKLSAML